MSVTAHKLDVLSRLNPQMQAVLAKQAELANGAFVTDVSIEQMRANYIAERSYWNLGGPTAVRTEQFAVRTRCGPVAIRLYYPSTEKSLPCVVFLHGGGFVVGNLDTHNRIQRILAERTGAVVAGVDYTLSPEAKYPQAVMESADVVTFLRETGARWGIDVNRIGMAGDSGGANMALGAALYLRDECADERELDCLLLFYGMYGLVDSMSNRLFGGSWDGMSAQDLQYYFSCYAETMTDLTGPYFNSLAADLSHGLPPTYIAAAALDPLLDDSRTLAAILDDHQLRHQFDVFDGVLHGFLHYTRMLDEANEVLDRAASFYLARSENNN